MPQQKITINLIKDLNGVSDFAESGLDEKGEEERCIQFTIIQRKKMFTLKFFKDSKLEI